MIVTRARLIEMIKEALMDPAAEDGGYPVPAKRRPNIHMPEQKIEQMALGVLDALSHLEPEVKRQVLNKAIYMVQQIGTSGSPSMIRIVTEKEKQNE
jgi:hypothetical protein